MLPGQLVGVVGPTGCGKSNIMDAVRWVLGESRASELRGESMQDVIFNGTTTRKPASRASVELVFDNADHRAGGQWSQFGEIAVRRVLTRDGTSSYFINAQPVRRRDVQDVFLGTGLGPRAYAIIGQGTISRIIESKPEELRLFLEEAAGVSKYKERRRETENRLADTRENLTRVEDILRELSANLDKLEKQAEVAQRFNGLTADATLKQHQLWFLRRAESETDQARVQAEAQGAVLALESRVADLRQIEAALETVRQAHYAAGDQVNQAQGLLYEASTEVGRLEAEIRFVVEGRQRVEQRLQTLADQALHWATRRDSAETELGRQLQTQRARCTVEFVVRDEEDIHRVAEIGSEPAAELTRHRDLCSGVPVGIPGLDSGIEPHRGGEVVGAASQLRRHERCLHGADHVVLRLHGVQRLARKAQQRKAVGQPRIPQPSLHIDPVERRQHTSPERSPLGVGLGPTRLHASAETELQRCRSRLGHPHPHHNVGVHRTQLHPLARRHLHGRGDGSRLHANLRPKIARMLPRDLRPDALVERRDVCLR